VDLLFDIVMILYWLALAVWFGAALFLTLAPRIILKTVRESNPVMTNVLSVNLEGQHATLLTGSIVARIMNVVGPMELVCAGVMLVAIAAQWGMYPPRGSLLVPALLRAALYLAATALLIYDRRFVSPRMWLARQEYIDNADNPDVANPALDRFDRYQNESEMVLRAMVFVLLGIILFSANIRPVLIVKA
jgi:hypothetical protein